MVVALTLAVGAGAASGHRAGAQQGVEVEASPATPGATVAEPATILGDLGPTVTSSLRKTRKTPQLKMRILMNWISTTPETERPMGLWTQTLKTGTSSG